MIATARNCAPPARTSSDIAIVIRSGRPAAVARAPNDTATTLTATANASASRASSRSVRSDERTSTTVNGNAVFVKANEETDGTNGTARRDRGVAAPRAGAARHLAGRAGAAGEPGEVDAVAAGGGPRQPQHRDGLGARAGVGRAVQQARRPAGGAGAGDPGGRGQRDALRPRAVRRGAAVGVPAGGAAGPACDDGGAWRGPPRARAPDRDDRARRGGVGAVAGRAGGRGGRAGAG